MPPEHPIDQNAYYRYAQTRVIKHKDRGGFMKNMMLAILIAGLMLAIPAKAEPFDSKLIAGAALTAAGVTGAFFTAKFFSDYSKEKVKLARELNNLPHDEWWNRSKKNSSRLWAGTVGSIFSASTFTAGIVLISLGLLSNKQTYTLPQMFNKGC